MKKLFLFLAITFLCYQTFGCSYVPQSFCASSSVSQFSNDLIISGRIVLVKDKSIDIEIIDVLRGNENRKVITVWSGKDFDCNGLFSMAASGLGKLNDKIIVRLPKITEKVNNWDVIGDYSRPDYFGYITTLKLENEKVKGFISGDANNTNANAVSTYESFKNSWKTSNDCSSIILSTKGFNTEKTIQIRSLERHKFKIYSSSLTKTQLIIFNINGVRIKNEIYFLKEVEVDMANFAKGIYVFHIISDGRKRQVYKVLKK